MFRIWFILESASTQNKIRNFSRPPNVVSVKFDVCSSMKKTVVFWLIKLVVIMSSYSL